MTLLSKYKSLLAENKFLHFGFLLTALHVSGGALAYVYQILMGRLLQPTEFSLFSSVMALSMFVSAPLGTISMLIIRRVSTLKAHAKLFFIKNFFFKINKILLIFGVSTIFVAWIARPYLLHYLKVENVQIINLLVLIILFNIFYVAGVAFVQGLQHFIFLGMLGLFGVLSKILISVALIRLGFGVEGALLGVLLSLILMYLIAMLVLFRGLPPQVSYQHFNLSFSSIKRALPVLVATTAFAAMTQLDMVIVNWYFSSNEAGLYAAASVLGKAVLYLPGGLILALFPMVSENHAKGSDSFRILQQAVIVTTSFCGMIACMYWFFGDFIIAIFYGESYRGAGNILRWYGITMLPLAIILIAEHYLIARGKVLFAWLFLFMLPIELLVIYFWHSEIWVILLIMGGFGLLLAIIGYGLMWRTAKKN